MAMFKPKEYQEATLKRLASYLESARFDGAAKAFDMAAREVPSPWNKPYVPLDGLAETPYVCLRLPTGGGKTFLAAQALKLGAGYLGREHNPLVLWLVPTDAIRQQTIETLQKPGHPNRESLEADFGENKVRVLDIKDFTVLTPQDLRDKACIVIGTFAALRVEKTDGRKFYEHTEYLEPHFAAVPPNMPGLELHAEGPAKGTVKKSCANIMAMVRPLVIVDEAHNAKTDLSYDVLNRVRAGCVIEFTATPAENSNVLHHVSASVLKSESMIKLPIMLTEYPTWQEALTDCILQRKKLHDVAVNEPDFVRPIALIQAENKDREVTVDVVVNYLVEQGKIERGRIAVATGSQRELDEVNLLDRKCQVEFVVTVQALKEGWNCPFAYVFCSVASAHSPKDVEQLLGRVLRMPWATRRAHEDLNRAYAFVSKACWPQAIRQLHDRLVSMGFDEVEAAHYVKEREAEALIQSPPPVPEREELVLREPPVFDGLPGGDSSHFSVTTDGKGTYVLSITGDVSPERAARIVAAAAPEDREAMRQRLAARRERILQPEPERPQTPVFRVPRLCVWRDGELEVAQEEHFMPADAWNLLDYPAELTPAEFSVEERANTYEIDIDGKRLTERYVATQTFFSFEEVATNWTVLQLSQELDCMLRRKDIRQEVQLEFIRRILRNLVDRRGISLNTLYRVRVPLQRAVRDKIDKYWREAYRKGYQEYLYGMGAAVETSYKYAFAFDPNNYPATVFYKGAYKFQKHFYPGRIADFDSKEEEECARAIDECEMVGRWVRNIVGLYNLPTSTGKFYPDFFVELADGRMMIAEYKGKHLDALDQEKRNIGELWERSSGGKAVFLWALKEDKDGRDVFRQLEDKIAGR